MEEEFASEIMSNRQNSIDQLFNNLSNDGVISFNIAGSVKSVESMTKSGMTPTREIIRSDLSQELKNIGFVETFKYDEYKSGFSETRSYVVAFKDAKTSKNWNTNQAETEVKLKNRIVRNQSTGEVSLEYFDAATMTTYRKFSASPEEQDMKEILTIARNKAHEAVEQTNHSNMVNDSNQQGANSSCSKLEGDGECANPALKVSEEQITSGESWSARDAVRES
jgi:hypothetical protein